jgi:AcrR family transcriptional regulator
MVEKRKYELKARAAKQAETRRRITEATVELHRTVGPASTRISEVARRAGVQRVTVYNNFPDEPSLLAACSQHWRALHPAPDPAAWAAVADPVRRLRVALGDLYAWYRETEPMTANVLRDAGTMPALRAIVEGGLGRYLEALQALLCEPFGTRGGRRARIQATVAAVVDFNFWRALAPLGDDAAAELAASFVSGSARTGSRSVP